MRRLLLSALLAPTLAMAQGSEIEQGRLAFMKAGCYQCHGTVGQGGVGPKLGPDPLPSVALSAFVRAGPRSMPPYSAAVLSDEDLARIRVYLASVPKPPAVKDLPELSGIR